MDTNAPIMKGPGLYEFLIEAELQHYYNNIKSDLKVSSAAQLKYVTDEDLSQLGMSKPEQRRLKKFYNRHFTQNYLSKFKRLLSVKRDDSLLQAGGNINIGLSGAGDEKRNGERSQGPKVPSKHIISSDSITVNKELGIGEFGVVQQGVWTNDGERIQVAIKCLARERMQNNPIEFLKEAAIMHSIDHAHIVRLYGVVLDTDSLMLVTELAPLRSLLECLKEPSLRSSFPVLTLCDFAMQVCDGMQYLEAKRLIHRDLAARNILVFSKNKVKISDFGLSRALGQGKDYYQTNFNVNLKLPIAWCAPECISYLRFTTASDVWAYGVTLWEMFSYGFQPWAALTGHQILEAIDEPNFQRLEQPDCCPTDHYKVMLDCWKHEPTQRPPFRDLATRLADCRPEQVQAKIANTDVPHLLTHRVEDIITVLDKHNNDHLWKGVLQNGKTGLFNPVNVVAYIGNYLPTMRPESFIRNDLKTSSRRKLNTTMISGPQGDFKHTGHVGLDGAYFGDLSFLGYSKSDYSSVPRQIVPPYKPQDDLEESPLLCGANTGSESLHLSDHINMPSLRSPLDSHTIERRSTHGNGKVRWDNDVPPPAPTTADNDHEYHEISDEESLVGDVETFDLGPSLMDEMESMFNLNSPIPNSSSTSAADHEGANKCNELRELTSRLSTTSKHRKQATVKPISASDQKTLDSAIALANEITARSMNDLDTEPAPATPVSPTKRKFSFRFPSTGGHNHEHDSKTERRNFSDEAQSIPDLQVRDPDTNHSKTVTFGQNIYYKLSDIITDSKNDTNKKKFNKNSETSPKIVANGILKTTGETSKIDNNNFDSASNKNQIENSAILIALSKFNLSIKISDIFRHSFLDVFRSNNNNSDKKRITASEISLPLPDKSLRQQIDNLKTDCSEYNSLTTDTEDNSSDEPVKKLDISSSSSDSNENLSNMLTKQCAINTSSEQHLSVVSKVSLHAEDELREQQNYQNVTIDSDIKFCNKDLKSNDVNSTLSKKSANQLPYNIKNPQEIIANFNIKSDEDSISNHTASELSKRSSNKLPENNVIVANLNEESVIKSNNEDSKFNETALTLSNKSNQLTEYKKHQEIVENVES